MRLEERENRGGRGKNMRSHAVQLVRVDEENVGGAPGRDLA